MGSTNTCGTSSTELVHGTSNLLKPPMVRYTKLKHAHVQVVHVPIGLAPMSFFVNLPHDMAKSLADKGGLKLSACTVAKLFSGGDDMGAQSLSRL